ncbi:DUF1450 domain-containing protein [Melghirimyces algeriensis]|uniref:Uncharacterized protein YuzB, UPF0349 family n=1 Tax=Melghirimyces algeriensis TaxID=910412 RepID=A0A521EFU6_9BACL|nr:DUF1450 domain-containing protein [Melghirimyces algeriensis]SMO82742.1 Uncharacterized protein YuzB, UPF0349 family [Melghirimyces algeriensis]
MRPMVEICINQLTPELEEMIEELENDSEVDVLESPCLGNCEVCAQTPYAMVDGEIITGKDGEELLKKIRQAIKEQEKKLDDLLDLL